LGTKFAQQVSSDSTLDLAEKQHPIHKVHLGNDTKIWLNVHSVGFADSKWLHWFSIDFPSGEKFQLATPTHGQIGSN
jgi:hypothetical protein